MGVGCKVLKKSVKKCGGGVKSPVFNMIMKEKMWGWGKWLDQKIEKNVGVGGSEKNPFPPPYTIKNGTALILNKVFVLLKP